MDHNPNSNPNPRRSSLLESLGEEITRIITPVSICMLSVVILVSILDSGGDGGASLTTVATMAYDESDSDSIWDKLKGAILNSVIFIAVVTAVTFLLVLLFYFRCTKFLKYYMAFSALMVLGFMGGEIALFLIQHFNFPIDCITFLVLLFNFTVVGVMAVFLSKMAIFVTQAYLVVIGVLVAYWFTLLPEWTTWVLLIAMALYDLAAVLLPGGPLRLLVELAMSRDEEIPALVYEARPVIGDGDNGVLPRRRVWSVGLDGNSGERSSLGVEEGRVLVGGSGELRAPLIQQTSMRMNSMGGGGSGENLALEGIGLGSSGAIKLGLGDFIFYSVLVGRAAKYDFMTVYACYLAIVAGLGITLLLLAFYRKALPALPFSIMLGVLFYLLTRLLLETFVVECSMNLLMF
ncbi:presenilin-like protein At2g29900 [Andrographis paniculata]|uniref:presenilin-like protein At2g29900 n=1 Tax=Andrographis paniculata TaxID=175694 RepID=UPI0021E73FC3|nr:presenilin-like protein At2g29900 [Andrographis paniculata]